MDREKIQAFLNEAPNCIKLCRLGDEKPLERLIAMIAFELGKIEGEVHMLEANANRWLWWKQQSEVVTNDLTNPNDWTRVLHFSEIWLRTQTESPDEFTDLLLKRFPLFVVNRN